MRKSKEQQQRETEHLTQRFNGFLRPDLEPISIIETAMALVATGAFRMNKQYGPKETAEALGTFISTLSGIKMDFLREELKRNQQEAKTNGQTRSFDSNPKDHQVIGGERPLPLHDRSPD